MVLVDCMKEVAEEMHRKSDAIRRDFSQHRLSAGDSREDLVTKFLADYLPKRFGVSTGFIISHDGKFSNQADIVIVDDQNNSPLHPDKRNKLWPIEAVYALIEVKTHLNYSDLTDAISKGQRFKRLQRRFCISGVAQNIKESLFVIWAFESPNPKTQKQNISKALQGVPRAEQPDFVIVPDCLVVQSGSYLELSRLGQPSSQHRKHLTFQYGNNLSILLPESFEVCDLGANSLLAWYTWFDSWLRQAGSRFTNPVDYLPKGYMLGKKV